MLTLIVSWMAGWFGGWIVLAILSPIVRPGADEFETGAKFLRLQYPVMAAVVIATVALWWGTLDQLRGY